MISRRIHYLGQDTVVACDARCGKAWGINCRPRAQLSDDPEKIDDYAWLADSELGEAPEDPGTYEGSDGKPLPGEERPNKWCVRQCERSDFYEPGAPIRLRDFSRRIYNCPDSDPALNPMLDPTRGFKPHQE